MLDTSVGRVCHEIFYRLNGLQRMNPAVITLVRIIYHHQQVDVFAFLMKYCISPTRRCVAMDFNTVIHVAQRINLKDFCYSLTFLHVSG